MSTVTTVTTSPSVKPIDVVRNFAHVVLTETGHDSDAELTASVSAAIDETERLFAKRDLFLALRRSTITIEFLGQLARDGGIEVDADGASEGVWVVTRHD